MEEKLDLLKVINKIQTNKQMGVYITHCAELKYVDFLLNSKALKSFDDLIVLANKKIANYIEEDNLDKADELTSTCTDIVDNFTEYIMGGVTFN